jgi:hypothetical protein
MSWFSENYEKAALGGAAVVAAGLFYLGWQKYGSVDEDFSAEPKGVGSNDPAVKDGDRVSTAKASFGLTREWVQGEDNGRPVDLFTGVALFVNKNDKSKPVDLLKDAPVHPPIPNGWWIEHRIDPGFGDSPQRDADEDGFSNLEEFTAKTDPNNAKDYPSLLAKLSYVGDESVQWVLRPGFESNGAFTFEYSDNLRKANKIGAANPVPPGQIFFAEGDVAKGRFKFIGSEKRREMNEAIRAEVDVTIVKVEDQKPNKLGKVYEIPSMFRRGDAGKFSQYDRTAILTLDAVGMAGNEFRVEENTEFSLPPGGGKATFKLIEVTPDKITVETTDKDGTKVTHEFAKGDKGPIAK